MAFNFMNAHSGGIWKVTDGERRIRYRSIRDAFRKRASAVYQVSAPYLAVLQRSREQRLPIMMLIITEQLMGFISRMRLSRCLPPLFATISRAPLKMMRDAVSRQDTPYRPKITGAIARITGDAFNCSHAHIAPPFSKKSRSLASSDATHAAAAYYGSSGFGRRLKRRQNEGLYRSAF